jgi:outer membrane protein
MKKVLALILLAVSAASLSAAEFKAGFVSTERVLQEANVAKDAQKKLELEFSKREKTLNDLGATVKDLATKLDRDAPTLSESQRIQRQRELVSLDQDFQRQKREFQEDLALRKNEELQKVLQKANAAIKAIAKAENYDLILQDAVYMNAKHDITEKVLRALNDAK